MELTVGVKKSWLMSDLMDGGLGGEDALNTKDQRN